MPFAKAIRMGTRGKPEESRKAILKAAVHEFAREGVSGARTDAIARSAGVNKALLYYYFKDKQTLYGAAMDHAFRQLSTHMTAVLDRDLPPGEKMRTYVVEYFDFIAQQPVILDLLQGKT